MASFHHRIKSGKKGTAAGHADYITRKGKYSHRKDLIEKGHGNMPEWVGDTPSLYWKTGDKHERANGAVYREHVIALPNELTTEQQKALVDDLIKGLVGPRPYEYAVHAPDASLEDAANTHVHVMFSDRMPDGINRSPEQTFSRYNTANPERGGCRKASGGKNRLALRDEVIAMRKTCANLQNTALEKAGSSARVDHRTLKEQGIDREPEQHLGPARIRNMSTADKEQYVANRQQRSQQQ